MISLNRLFFIFFVTYYIFHFHLINASFHDSLRDNKKGIDTKIRGAPVENTDSDEVKNIHQAMSSFYKSYTTAKSGKAKRISDQIVNILIRKAIKKHVLSTWYDPMRNLRRDPNEKGKIDPRQKPYLPFVEKKHEETLFIDGNFPRSLRINPMSMSKYVVFDVVREMDGTCYKQPPSCAFSTSSGLSSSSSSFSTIHAANQAANLRLKREQEEINLLRETQYNLDNDIVPRTERYEQEYLEKNSLNRSGYWKEFRQKMEDKTSFIQLKANPALMAQKKELQEMAHVDPPEDRNEEIKQLEMELNKTQTAIKRDVLNEENRAAIKKFAGQEEKKKYNEQRKEKEAQDEADEVIEESIDKDGKVGNLRKRDQLKKKLELSDAAKKALEEDLAMMRVAAARKLQDQCLSAFAERVEKRESYHEMMNRKGATCLVTGYGKVRTGSNYEYDMKEEGVFQLYDGKDGKTSKYLNIAGTFEKINEYLVGLSKIDLVYPNERLSVHIKNDQIYISVDCAYTSLKPGNVTEYGSKIVKVDNDAWRIENNVNNFTVDIGMLRNLPSAHKNCPSCKAYFNFQLSTFESFTGQNPISGLCGRYFKGGIESDRWYFGDMKDMQGTILTRFQDIDVPKNIEKCMDSDGINTILSCTVLGDLHVSTPTRYRYQILHSPFMKELILSKGADVFRILVDADAGSDRIIKSDGGGAIHGLRGIAFTTRENETITITTKNGDFVVKSKCGPPVLNDIITAGGVRIEGIRSNRLRIATSSLNQLIIRKGDGMDDLFLNVYLLLNPHTVDFSNHIGVCGTLSLDTISSDTHDKTRKYFSSMSIKKDLEKNLFNLDMLHVTKKSDSYFCGDIEKIQEEERTELAITSETKLSACRFLGPGLVETFGKYVYHVRNVGNFLAFQHESIPESIYVQSKLYLRNQNFRKSKQSSYSNDEGAIPDILALSSFAIKFESMDELMTDQYLTISINENGMFIIQEDCNGKTVQFLIKEKMFQPRNARKSEFTVIHVNNNTLTVDTPNLSIRLFSEMDGYFSSFVITAKIPDDRKATGLCGVNGDRGKLDDMISFGPAKSLVSTAEILKYHDLTSFEDNKPFCKNNDALLRNNGVTNLDIPTFVELDESELFVDRAIKMCESLSNKKIAKYCRNDYGNSNLDKFDMYVLVDKKLKRFEMDEALANNAERSKKSLVPDDICKKLGSDISRQICYTDRALYAGVSHINFVKTLIDIDRDLRGMSELFVKLKNTTCNVKRLNEVIKTSFQEDQIEKFCVDLKHKIAKEFCIDTIMYSVANHRNDGNYDDKIPSEVPAQLESALKNFENSFKTFLKAIAIYKTTNNTISANSVIEIWAQNGDTYRGNNEHEAKELKRKGIGVKHRLSSIKIDSLNERFRSFSIPLSELRANFHSTEKQDILLPTLITFFQPWGYCSCCDRWSIRNVATSFDRRDDSISKCNGTTTTCSFYGHLKCVEEEKQSVVYYETDLMSDSRSILFEYSFTNVLQSNPSDRCGKRVDPNIIEWSSYEDKKEQGLEEIRNNNYTEEILDFPKEEVINRKKTIINEKSTGWQLEVFASLDDGTSWTSLGWTPPYMGKRTASYDLILPKFHESGKGLVKYRIQQDTKDCECCDDLFVRYIIPIDEYR